MEAAAPAAPAVPERLLISVRDIDVVEGPAGIIGQGALGEVRRGRRGPVQLALKNLHLLRNDAASVAAMGGALAPREREHVMHTFWKECALLQRASHRNIVQFVGVVVDDTEQREPLFLASEFIESGTLQELIYGERHAALRSDDGLLPLTTQLVALEGLFAALEHLSGIPLIHRDIKPANVLVVIVDGMLQKILVTDFGEAKQLTQTMTHRALAGTQAGTPLYMAPEMREADEEKGPKADVFSAGVLAIEISTRKAPNPGPEMVKEGRRRVAVPEEQRRAADIAAVRHEAVLEIVQRSVVDDERERADASALHALCTVRLAEAQPVQQFELRVKSIDGTVFVVRVARDTTISRLKQLVIDQMGQHRLVFAGRQMENERTVGDYNLLDGTTVHMTNVVSGVAQQEKERRTEVERLNAELHGQLEEVSEQMADQRRVCAEYEAQLAQAAVQNAAELQQKDRALALKDQRLVAKEAELAALHRQVAAREQLREGMADSESRLQQVTEAAKMLQERIVDQDRQYAKEQAHMAREQADLVEQLLQAAQDKEASTPPADVSTAAAQNEVAAVPSGVRVISSLMGEKTAVESELRESRLENERLNNYLNSILAELEAKSPLINEQREAYEKAIHSHTRITQQLDAAKQEVRETKAVQQQLEASLEAAHRKIEVLEATNAGLGLQIQKLESARVGCAGSSQIPSLQKRNEEQLAQIAQLEADLAQTREAAETGPVADRQETLQVALLEVEELRAALKRQEEMVAAVVHQRDVYRQLLQARQQSGGVAQNQLTDVVFPDDAPQEQLRCGLRVIDRPEPEPEPEPELQPVAQLEPWVLALIDDLSDDAHSKLQLLLGNIDREPGEKKFRTLKTKNKSMSKFLAAQPAVELLLKLAGFEEGDDCLVFPSDAPLENLRSVLRATDKAEPSASSQHDVEAQAAASPVELRALLRGAVAPDSLQHKPRREPSYDIADDCGSIASRATQLKLLCEFYARHDPTKSHPLTRLTRTGPPCYHAHRAGSTVQQVADTDGATLGPTTSRRAVPRLGEVLLSPPA